MNEIFAAREPSAAPPPPVRPAPFEFSGPQEALFTSLSKLMRFVGGASIVFGLLALLTLLQARGNALVVLIQATLMVAMGWLTMSAGGSFRQVSETSGRDISHLMEALTRLRTIYLFQVWMLALALVFLAAVMIWVMFKLATR